MASSLACQEWSVYMKPVFLAKAMALFVTIIVTSTLVMAQTKKGNDGIPGPKFITMGSVATVPRTSKTIPHWTSSFTTDGVVFPFTMVGTNPATSNAATV